MPTYGADNIYYADGSTVLSIADISAATASSVQDAFDVRQKQSFRWADSAAQANQTGMAQGDVGYNETDDIEYYWHNSDWKPWNKMKASYTATISSFALATTATSIIAHFSISSGICLVEFSAVLGTGAATGIGTLNISLPPGLPSVASASFYDNNAVLQGSIQMQNNAGTVIYGGLVRTHATDTGLANILRASATAGQYAQVTSALPFAWAAGDNITGAFSYLVA